jgi:hemoglobin/transferrin/lactoferrin receptor protein
MRRHLVGVFAATIAAACAPAAAQEGAASTESPVYGTMLEPITVFATLNPIESFDYPGQVEVVGRERLDELQASSLSDIFEGVPGAVVDGGPRRSGETPSIRGFAEEDVLILLDGVRQSFVSGHDGRLFIEPELLKQVEIVKGPISSLYGSGALGGVIAMTTVDAKDFLDPGETAGVKVKGGYQSVNDEFLITTTAFTRSHDGTFDIVGSVAYRESGDIELGDGSVLPDDHEIHSGLLKGTVQIAPGLSFTSSWVRYRDDAITPDNPQYDNIPGVPDEDGAIPINMFRTVLSDTVQGTLSYKPEGNPYIDSNFQTYWARNKVEEDQAEGLRVISREVETIGVKADNRSRFDLSDKNKLTLTYGAEYYQDEQVGRDNTSLDGGRDGVPGATADFAGVFTQAELKMLEPAGLPGEFTIIPGVRFDRFTNEAAGEEPYADTAVSPKLGLAYKPVPWLLLFGNYGEAFRAPSFNELYADGVHFRLGPTIANRFVASPDLRPQDGSTIEGGIGLEFKDVASAGDKITMKGSYWKSKVDDFIDLQVNGVGEGGPTDIGCFVPRLGPCTSEFVNVPHAELEGFELSARYDIGRFYGIASYATIDGVNTDTGDYLGVLQPDKLFFDLGVKLPEYWMRLGTRLTFADEFDEVNGDEKPRDAYHTIGLYAAIEPGEGPLKGFRVDLAVENITDEDYEVVAAGAEEPGINFKAALGWTTKW